MKKLIKKLLKRKYSGRFMFSLVGFLAVFYTLGMVKFGVSFKGLAVDSARAYWEMVELKSAQWLELHDEMLAREGALLVKAYPLAAEYVPFIMEVSREVDVDPIWLARIIVCESGGKADAVNISSQAVGLMQFMPSTWLTTPYAEENMFDPEMQIRAAAWMYSEGRQAEWECN